MKKEKIKFISYDGYKLEGTYESPEKTATSAVLFVHGITSDRDELGFHSDMAEFLSMKDIASLRFDYRYHGKYKSSLEKLTLLGIVNDINAAFNALKVKAQLKIPNYFLVGTSFGGGLSAYWAERIAKEDIRKIILNAPVLDYEDDVLRRNKLVANGILSDKAIKQLNSKGYVKSSDIHFGRGLINEVNFINASKLLSELGSKVWIFHGKDDEDVPLTSTQKFRSPATGLTIVPNVGHGFGIDIDEDLDHPETKKVHQKIYQDVWQLIKEAAKG